MHALSRHRGDAWNRLFVTRAQSENVNWSRGMQMAYALQFTGSNRQFSGARIHWLLFFTNSRTHDREVRFWWRAQRNDRDAFECGLHLKDLASFYTALTFMKHETRRREILRRGKSFQWERSINLQARRRAPIRFLWIVRHESSAAVRRGSLFFLGLKCQRLKGHRRSTDIHRGHCLPLLIGISNVTEASYQLSWYKGLWWKTFISNTCYEFEKCRRTLVFHESWILSYLQFCRIYICLFILCLSESSAVPSQAFIFLQDLSF